MSRAIQDAELRLWRALVTLAYATLCLLLPSLVMATSDVSTTIAVGVLAAALAALVQVGMCSAACAPSGRSGVLTTADDAPPLLTGRITDPVHQPLRPRAPGLA